MEEFNTTIRLEFITGCVGARLMEDYSYVDKHGRKHTAPRGMYTDGISSPVKHLLDSGFHSPYLGAAIIHDHQCYIANELWHDGEHEKSKALRKNADKLFHEMLLELGCPKKKARVMYWGVRIGAMIP